MVNKRVPIKDWTVEKPFDSADYLDRPTPRAKLGLDTAFVGQRVEVWEHPDVQPVPYQGERGEIVTIWPSCEYADVRLDGYGWVPVTIPLYDLIAM